MTIENREMEFFMQHTFIIRLSRQFSKRINNTYQSYKIHQYLNLKLLNFNLSVFRLTSSGLFYRYHVRYTWYYLDLLFQNIATIIIDYENKDSYEQMKKNISNDTTLFVIINQAIFNVLLKRKFTI